MDTSPSIYDNIRFTLGATGDNAGLVLDDEIDNALSLYSEWRLAAAFIADSLAARAINDPSSFAAPGDLSVSWGDRAKAWMNIAKRLREEVREATDQAQGPIGIQAVQLYREAKQHEPEYSRRRMKGLRR